MKEDGLVRKVVLRYKLPNERNYCTVDDWSIHNISVIIPVEDQMSNEDEEMKHTAGGIKIVNSNFLNLEAEEFLKKVIAFTE